MLVLPYPTNENPFQSEQVTDSTVGGSTPHLARCFFFTLLVLSLEEQGGRPHQSRCTQPWYACVLASPEVINLQITSFSYNKAFVLELFHLRYRPGLLSSEPTQSCQIEPVLAACFPFPTTVRVSTSCPLNAEQTPSWRDRRQKAGTQGPGPESGTWSRALELALTPSSLPVLLHQIKQTREEGEIPTLKNPETIQLHHPKQLDGKHTRAGGGKDGQKCVGLSECVTL